MALQKNGTEPLQLELMKDHTTKPVMLTCSRVVGRVKLMTNVGNDVSLPILSTFATNHRTTVGSNSQIWRSDNFLNGRGNTKRDLHNFQLIPST